MRYHHRQIGWAMLLIFGVTALGVILLAARVPGPSALGRILTWGTVVLLGSCAAYFSTLTVDVTDTELVSYSVLASKRKQSVSLKSPIPPVCGESGTGEFGIKFFGPGKWLYNVSGLDIIEVELKMGGWVRIGTDDPIGLLQALNNLQR